jgi:hypothetical protein
MLTAGCSRQHSNIYNPWNIADNDSMSLSPPHKSELYQISSTLFKAINPRFIANVYGVTTLDDGKRVNKVFELVSFDSKLLPNYDDPKPLTSLNVRKKWNYYINDKHTEGYSRVLISAFLLQAFEKVEYITSDSMKTLLVWGMPVDIEPADIAPEDPYPYERISRDGSIRVYIRDISKNVINDKTTIYLINNQIVTRKIYEAVNPVYIRSLKRITDKVEIEEYGQAKNIKEIVDVELFTYDELQKNPDSKGSSWGRIVECRECSVYIVDNIQIDLNIYDALRGFFFKKVHEISEDNKEAFEPYRKLFPEKNLGFTKCVTIITM